MRRPSWVWVILAAGATLAIWSTAVLADGQITAGTQWWEQSTPEAKFQEFREVPDGVFVESFLYRDRVREGHLSLWGTNAIRSDQAYTADYRRPRWRIEVGYQETPHNISFVSRTGYTLVEPDLQLLPDSLQRLNQENPGAYVATMRDFLNVANRANLTLDTDVLRARLAGRPGQGLAFELKGSRRNRSGHKPYGGSFGFNNAIETIEPIRQKMAEGRGRLSFTKKRVAAEASLEYSAFQNDHGTLIWDNPKRLADTLGTPSQGRLDLYPDNQAWRAGGQIGIQLPRRTAFTASASYGQVTQDDDWLPFTVNTAVLAPDTFPLPGTNTDGKAKITTIDARLTSHPISRAGGTLRFHQHQYDNETPPWTLSGQVPYDGSWNGTDVTSHPFGNEQMVYGADLSWSPVPQIALFGTAEHIRREHTFREVPEDKEDAFEGKVRVKPRSSLQADLRYRHGDRELEEFEETDYQNASGQFIEQPELRRFDVADRIQDLVEASVSWSGSERVTVSATFGYLENDYENTHLGLLDDVRRSAGIGATIQATDRIGLGGNVGWARIYANQRSRQSAGTLALTDSASWQARLTDEIISADANITWETIPDRLKLTTSFFYDRSPGIFRLTNFAGTGQDLPSTVYRRQGAGIEALYTVQEGLELAGRWMWEQFDATDFSSEDIPLLFPLTGAANAVFLGDSVLDYRANAVSLVITRSF